MTNIGKYSDFHAQHEKLFATTEIKQDAYGLTIARALDVRLKLVLGDEFVANLLWEIMPIIAKLNPLLRLPAQGKRNDLAIIRSINPGIIGPYSIHLHDFKRFKKRGIPGFNHIAYTRIALRICCTPFLILHGLVGGIHPFAHEGLKIELFC